MGIGYAIVRIILLNSRSVPCCGHDYYLISCILSFRFSSVFVVSLSSSFFVACDVRFDEYDEDIDKNDYAVTSVIEKVFRY